MESFSRRAFWYTFGIAVSMSFAITLAVIVTQDRLTVLSVLLAILLSLGISVVSAALIACYRYPKRWLLSAVRSVMRKTAKRAIGYGLSQAMTPVRCLGIMEREGYVYLRLGIGISDGIREGFPFQVFESTDNQLWGIVEVVSVEEHRCDCIPVLRINEDFWAALERKMKCDTSPPSNVHLIVGYPPPVMLELTDWLLDNWR